MLKVGEMDSIQVVWMNISVKEGGTGELRFNFYFSCAYGSQVPLSKSIHFILAYIFCWR